MKKMTGCALLRASTSNAGVSESSIERQKKKLQHLRHSNVEIRSWIKEKIRDRLKNLKISRDVKL